MQTPLKERQPGLGQYNRLSGLLVVMETLCRADQLEHKANQVEEAEVVDDDYGNEQAPEDMDEVESKDEGLSKCPKKNRVWEPSTYSTFSREKFHFAGHDIDIQESLDSYAALIWPGAIALCQYLEVNSQEIDLTDKAVLEIGAGTGLLSVVASLLGAWVTATDMPDVLGNLTCNLMRNTRGRCRYTPQVGPLCWEQDLVSTYPRSAHRYDYVLAADVVYHHDFLKELLDTMRHFCQPGTRLIWSNKVRFQSDLRFTENFKSAFHTTLLAELPDEEVKIFMATSRE